jgi:hypothetical protein
VKWFKFHKESSSVDFATQAAHPNRRRKELVLVRGARVKDARDCFFVVYDLFLKNNTLIVKVP